MASLSRCLLICFSWALARSPDFVGAGLCRVLGGLVYTSSTRRHDILSALDHAFPEKDMAWKKRICRLHCTRMIEMFLIVLAMRHWSEAEMKERLQLSPSYSAFFEGAAKDRPSVLFLTHASTTEAMAMLPIVAEDFPKSMTLYRALDHPVLEAFVKESREIAGNTLHARREGLLKAKKALQSGRNTVGILFDQSAGSKGHLSLFFNRLCTTSNLAAMLATKTDAAAAVLYIKREGFWRGTLIARPLPKADTPDQLLRAANAELETILRENDSQCADWFWAHKRWKATLRKRNILNLERLKSYLPQELSAARLERPPQSIRIALRLDSRPELLALAGPIAEIIRLKRPDAFIWLLVPDSLRAESLPVHDKAFALPSGKKERKLALKDFNAQYFPDALISLDPSATAVKEAKLIQCDFRSSLTYSTPPKHLFDIHHVTDAQVYLENPYATLIEFLDKFEIPRTEIEVLFPTPASNA